MKVFVSYRRADVGGYAGRLNDALKGRLGADQVFQDVAAIGPGRIRATARHRVSPSTYHRSLWYRTPPRTASPTSPDPLAS